ncbi:hypothetical protein BaRGS_00003505, partial [Batillaria attramentaria]
RRSAVLTSDFLPDNVQTSSLTERRQRLATVHHTFPGPRVCVMTHVMFRLGVIPLKHQEQARPIKRVIVPISCDVCPDGQREASQKDGSDLDSQTLKSSAAMAPAPGVVGPECELSQNNGGGLR